MLRKVPKSSEVTQIPRNGTKVKVRTGFRYRSSSKNRRSEMSRALLRRMPERNVGNWIGVDSGAAY